MWDEAILWNSYWKEKNVLSTVRTDTDGAAKTCSSAASDRKLRIWQSNGATTRARDFRKKKRKKKLVATRTYFFFFGTQQTLTGRQTGLKHAFVNIRLCSPDGLAERDAFVRVYHNHEPDGGVGGKGRTAGRSSGAEIVGGFRAYYGGARHATVVTSALLSRHDAKKPVAPDRTERVV